jgi:hypothetical protein
MHEVNFKTARTVNVLEQVSSLGILLLITWLYIYAKVV